MHSQENASDAHAARQVPFDNEAEQAVLGAMLLDFKETLPRVAPIVDDSMFYREAHRILFRTMVALAEGGSAVDPVTLRAALNGELAAVGGMEYVATLID